MARDKRGHFIPATCTTDETPDAPTPDEAPQTQGPEPEVPAEARATESGPAPAPPAEPDPRPERAEPTLEERINMIAAFIREGEARIQAAREEQSRLLALLAESGPAATALEHATHARRITEDLRAERGTDGLPFGRLPAPRRRFNPAAGSMAGKGQ